MGWSTFSVVLCSSDAASGTQSNWNAQSTVGHREMISAHFMHINIPVKKSMTCHFFCLLMMMLRIARNTSTLLAVTTTPCKAAEVHS